MVAQLIKTLIASAAEEAEGGGADVSERTDSPPSIDTESKDYQRMAREMNAVKENEQQALNQLAQATGMYIHSILDILRCIGFRNGRILPIFRLDGFSGVDDHFDGEPM